MRIKRMILASLTFVVMMTMVGCNSKVGDRQPSLNDEKHETTEPVEGIHGVEYLSDSLALVAIYKATDGDNWHYNDNWLVRGIGIKKWYGVKTSIIDGQERVTDLRLGANRLTGKFPKEIASLTELRTLGLSENYKLTGEIPEEIYNLRHLKVWKMRFTDVYGELSPKIGNLVELDSLDLWGAPWGLTKVDNWVPKGASTLLSGKIPAEIGKLTKARYIVLGRNKFSGEIPEEIGNLTNLRYLDIARGELTGSIPGSIGNLKNLEILYVAGNELSGEIPEEMGKMSNLKEFYAGENQFTGSIPSSFANLMNLNSLALDNNQLSGDLPQVVGLIKNLYILYLENNQFTGSIPVELGGVDQPHLITARLSNNNLTGSLPAIVPHDYIVDGINYGKVYSTFYVDGNRLTGVIPDEYYSNGVVREGVLPQQPGYNLK